VITIRKLVLFLAAVSCLGSWKSAAGETAPQLLFSGESAELDLHQKAGRFLVEVHVGAAGPFDFLIDTGAGVSVIDAAIAASLGLEVIGSSEVGAPGGELVPVDKVRAPELSVGAITISGAQPVVLNIGEMSGGLIQGVLGMDLFHDVVLTLDATAARAKVARGALAPDAPGVVSFDRSSGRMKFDIDVAGLMVAAQIDTGSPAGFTLPIERMEGLPFLDEPEQRGRATLVGGTRSIRKKRLDGSIRFGGLEFENPHVSFMEPSPGTANIGSAILNTLVVEIDSGSGRIAFRRAAGPETTQTREPAPRPPASPRRLGIRFRGFRGGGLREIAGVEPGSLGQQAGFEAGDIIVSLNARPMSDYDQTALGTLIRGATPLVWEIERAGEHHVIEVR
jgi:hypothetical protein